ncbi:MAG: hypothetical protein ACK45B_07670 [Limisphaerales bacterium]
MFTLRNWCLFGGGAVLGAALMVRLVWPSATVPDRTATPAPPVHESSGPPVANGSLPADMTIVGELPALPPPALPGPDSWDDAATLAQIAEERADPDPLTVRRLAAHLQHASPAVRAAAREALRVTGDPAALPDLQRALEAATEAEEAVELADLIAYLRLPSYTELRDRDPWLRNPGAQRARMAAGLPVKTAPSSTTAPHTASLDALAALRAENERLRAENERLRARVGLAGTP